MSGVAGGNRIKRQNVQDTFNDFTEKVLSKIPGYKVSSLSGSVKAGSKPDFGDLDIIATFEYDDKKVAKQAIIDTVSKMPDSLIMPFKSERYAGKRFYNSGEIISVLYPIKGAPGESIQVDIMVSLSEVEHQFKNSFLDLPAEVQGLILGLVKTALLEQDPAEVFARLGIKNVPPLEANQEYEFNLSSVNLTLRKVTLDNFKEIAREEIWKSNNWEDIKNLLKDFDLSQSFEKLLDQVTSSLKNPRSKNRVAGIFRSMVSVKSGEVGTPKGDNKEKALAAVAQTLTEAEGTVIGLYGGGFKPPHRGHFHIAKELAKDVDLIKIYIGGRIREGEIITAQQSKEIWEVYAKYLGKPTEIEIAPITPILSIYQEIEANPKQDYVVGSSSEPGDVGKFKALQLNKDNFYDKAKLKIVSTINEEKLSATTVRTDAEYLKTGQWMPEELSADDKKAVLGILKATPEYKMAEAIDDVFSNFLGESKKEKAEKEEETSEVSMGTPVTPISVVPSVVRQRMQDLTVYFRDLAPDDVIVDFNGQSIVITPMIYNKAEPTGPADFTPQQKPINELGTYFNYVPYIAGILEHMITKGMKVVPLPDIKTRQDEENAAKTFGKTATYDPGKKEVVLYVTGRHPKDVMRSFCHEMIHHMQNLEGRLPMITTTNTQEDSALNEIEKEAHFLGSMTMREYEDSIKNQDTLEEGTKYRSIVADVRQAVNDALNVLITGKEELKKQAKDLKLKGEIEKANKLLKSINKVKGYNIKTIREPGKKDIEIAGKYGMSSLGAMLSTESQVAYLGEFTSQSEKGTRSKDGKPITVEVNLKFAQSNEVKPGEYYIDGEASSDDGELDIIIAFNPGDGASLLQKIQPTLTDLIRHEIEHLTQSGAQLQPTKWMRGDLAMRKRIRQNPETFYKYFMLPKEVDANIQGLYMKANYDKTDFQSTVDQYLDSLVDTEVISVEKRKEVYDKFKARIPQIGGIPNLN
jgi:hypothetical protein